MVFLYVLPPNLFRILLNCSHSEKMVGFQIGKLWQLHEEKMKVEYRPPLLQLATKSGIKSMERKGEIRNLLYAPSESILPKSIKQNPAAFLSCRLSSLQCALYLRARACVLFFFRCSRNFFRQRNTGHRGNPSGAPILRSDFR